MNDPNDFSVGDTCQLIELAGRVHTLEDLEAPRDGGLATVQLLVEVVADTTDGLREQDSGRNRITERGHRNAASTAADPRTDAAEEHCSPDSEASLPHLECVEWLTVLAEISGPVGQNVVEPATDQTEGNGPDRDVENGPLLAAAGDPTTISPHDRDDDAEDDEERVGAKRHRSDVPDALGRAGDIGQQVHS